MVSTSVLMVMIVISVAVRFWQEYLSGIAMCRLQSSIATKIREIVLEIYFVPGAIVPADCLILESSYLRTSQSAWTGESESIFKKAGPHDSKEVFYIFDYGNVALTGTNVVPGHGVGLVLRTGDDVMIATIIKEIEKKRQPNAFQKGIVNVSCVKVLVISHKTTVDWKNAALFSISVDVGLVPETPPAIINANLARAAPQLSKKQAIVKRLDSVQNLGAITVLCSDKTGTITEDELSVHNYINTDREKTVKVNELVKVDSQIQGNSANNMDKAMLNFRLLDGADVVIAHYDKVRAIPFDFERRRSGCVIRGITGQNLLVVKGAFEEVLSRYSSMRSHGKSDHLSHERQQHWREMATQMNMEGYCVLLVAGRPLRKSFVDDVDILVNQGLQSNA
ncbi:hypothetical protein ACHAPD_006618 [Fusarium lateritium]